MGVAAYNRGSRAIREDIAKGSRRHEFELMDTLNAIRKNDDAATPFGRVFIIASHKGWFIECPKTGFGYWYKSIYELMRRWNVALVGNDHGTWIAEPI